MSSSSSTPAAAPPPPPLPPLPPAPEVVAVASKKSILRRVFPLLVIANVVVGVYVFTRASKKQPSEKVPSAPEPVVTKEATVPEEKAPTETTPVLKVLPPIPEHDQRELFKWILEEKRKVKPRDKLEKKKLNEEKALLKEFIRSESLPSL